MDFKKILQSENIHRIFILGSIYTGFELVGLILSTLGVFESDIRLYVSIIVLFHIGIISFILIHKEFNITKYHDFITNLYVLVVLLWSVVLTTLVYIKNRDITVIVLVLLITSTFIIIDYKIYGVFLTLSYMLYAWLTYHAIAQTELAFELLFKGIIFYGLAYTMNRYNYHNRLKIYETNETLIEKNLDLLEQSKRDSLSGLYNNAYIYNHLEELISISAQAYIAVLMLDLDNFKNINDAYGHLFGDQVIKKVSEQLIKSTGPEDVLGRYGGEEFIVIIKEGNVDHTMMIAEAIRINIEQMKFDIPVKVTISIGIALNNGDDAKSLIKKADEQLYRAKALGKNRVSKEEEI
ncbi:MAG: GGDEF domain-containing protein [Clostridia bacterium]|nr:GGDEF domain-containing protein [Clostridia bacterium]